MKREDTEHTVTQQEFQGDELVSVADEAEDASEIEE